VGGPLDVLQSNGSRRGRVSDCYTERAECSEKEDPVPAVPRARTGRPMGRPMTSRVERQLADPKAATKLVLVIRRLRVGCVNSWEKEADVRHDFVLSGR